MEDVRAVGGDIRRGRAKDITKDEEEYEQRETVWWKPRARSEDEDMDEKEEIVKNPMKWWADEEVCDGDTRREDKKGDKDEKDAEVDCEIQKRKTVKTAREGTQEPKSRESPEKHRKNKEKGRGPGT